MPPRSEPRIGAFFDVDKTILAENSGTLYFKYLYERGEVGLGDALRNLASYLRYKLDLLDVERWTARTMEQWFRGLRVEDVERQARQWFESHVLPVIYPEARAQVRRHREQGHVVALVSASTDLVIGPLAANLGVEHILHTRLEVRDGVFTGRVIPPLCFGEGKIYWLRQLIERERIDLARSYFYTDSITDRPLLDLVGHPVAVNPDLLLYWEARRRRWPVRLFTPPVRHEANGARASDATRA